MILKLENVCKTFTRNGAPVPALNDVSLEVWPGEFIGIVGPSGAGKTTLLKVAGGLLAPDKGKVFYRDVDIATARPNERELLRRRYVSTTWGAKFLQPGMSVLDNVIVRAMFPEPHGERKTAEQFARAMLEICGCEHCLDARPPELSDGERQRVAIAQALASAPQLLLADEPAANLDIYEQEWILDVLRSVAKEVKLGVVIADADLLGVAFSQTIIYMKHGTIIISPDLQGFGDRLHESYRKSYGLLSDDA